MTMRNLGLSLTLSLGVIAFYAGTASAQFIDITAGGLTYTQNFNTLTTSTAVSEFINGTADGVGSAGEGIYAFVGGTSTTRTTLGNNANVNDTPIAGGDGTSNTGGLYSFGAGTSTERALGTLLSGATNTQFIGFRFQNLTGADITGFTVSYTGEQYRRGTASRTDRLDFQYSATATTVNDASGFTDADALDFVSAAGAGTGPVILTSVIGPQTVTLAAPVANGGSLFLRFNDFNASGGDDGLAVDDFSFTAIAGPTSVTVPEASTFALFAPVLGVLGVIVARRRKLA